MSHIQITLAPELHIAPNDFVTAWNENVQTSQTGQLTVVEAKSPIFHDPSIAMLVLETAVAITSGVLINLIHDLIKDKYYPKEKPEIIEISQADGTKLIIVKVKE